MDMHIFWEGPFNLEEVASVNNLNRDYGVYQVYGHHPLYGSNILLYIGLASEQTFAKRISQHEWMYRADPENIQVYVGRFAGKNRITNEKWAEVIEQAEKLLIYAHKPAFNTQSTKSIPEDDVLNNRIFNWLSHRDLFPEVSGSRFTSKYGHITKDCIYDLERKLE